MGTGVTATSISQIRDTYYDYKYWENNQKLAIEIAEIAESKGITPAQLALAWILAQSENIIPIPGTKRIKYLEENAKAVDVNLSTEDVSNIQLLLKKYLGLASHVGFGHHQ